jgi:predicted nucleic acid-binding Zn ribbon protein
MGQARTHRLNPSACHPVRVLLSTNYTDMNTCPICKKPFKRTSNSQKFCSSQCRESTYKDYRAKFQLERYDRIALKLSPDKIQCLYCGRYYVQVGTHVVERHGMTAREYREYYDLERKRGIVPEWYRKQKGDQALENKTYKNLETGAPHRFVKGDKKAGRYERSHVTMERLKNQFKNAKKNNSK